MCGIAGILDPSGAVADPEATLRSMATAMRHRGPDDEGVAWLADARIGFAFRRLAIQDVSQAGHQPMRSASGRYTLVFNGEIYNFAELRPECGDVRFRGGSDTEVMLALFERHGVRASIDRMVGMFACAVWDAAERELTLIRDRLGVKPLFVGLGGEQPFDLDGFELAGRTLAFASELKSLRPVAPMRFRVDPAALTLFLRYGYVPGPWTIHPTVRSLPPGHLLRIRDGRARLERYWSSAEAAESAAPFAGSFEDAVGETRRLLEQSVRGRMIADVPVGAFLSGGIDSSAVVAAMRSVAPGRVRAFTIAMEDARHDESERATAIARHLGVEHTVLRFTADEALRGVEALPSIWDNPFADSSQLATHLVARLARSHVTVALSGDGGDEVFGGYERYRRVPEIARWPRAARAIGAAILPGVARLLEPLVGDRAHKLAPLLGLPDAWAMFERLTQIVPEPASLLLDAPLHRIPLNDPRWLLRDGPIERRMMQADLVSYLVDDILVKVDRATMAVGLEGREPLLDHRLVEFALRVPIGFHVAGGRTKRLLRAVLADSLPAALIDGPKRGFSVPLLAWLRGPLRPWAEGLLEERRLRDGGRFRPEAVRALWLAVQRGERLEHQLWNVLMFQAWEARWGSG